MCFLPACGCVCAQSHTFWQRDVSQELVHRFIGALANPPASPARPRSTSNASSVADNGLSPAAEEHGEPPSSPAADSAPAIGASVLVPGFRASPARQSAPHRRRRPRPQLQSLHQQLQAPGTVTSRSGGSSSTNNNNTNDDDDDS